MKRMILAIMVLALLVASGAALSSASAEIRELNITYVKAPLNIPSIVQKRMELFEKEFGPQGITVGHPEITAGPKQTQAMAAGSVDFANCVGGTSVLIAASQGLDIRIIGIYGRSPKAFTLLVNDPGVKSLADLKGKKIAGPKGTVLHQLLAAALKKEGMAYDDVQHIEMGIPHGVAALFGGSVDGALAAGPSVADALSKGARILFDGEGLVDATTVVAVRGELLRTHPEIVRSFDKVRRASVAFMKADTEEAFRLTAEETGLSVEQVREMAPLYDFDPEIRPSDIEELKRTQDFLLEAGLITKTIDVESLIEVVKP